MSVLPNTKHELFAQAVAQGRSAAEAYVIAGYQPSRTNAARLSANEDVRSRIEEILSEAAAKVGVTVERIVAELAKIGFADIRKAVAWNGSHTRETDNPDGGDVLVIRETFSQLVRLVDSDKIDDDTAAAIAEVRQSPTGGLSIKMHDKRAALVDLGKHLGMFVDRQQTEHSGEVGIRTITREIIEPAHSDSEGVPPAVGVGEVQGG